MKKQKILALGLSMLTLASLAGPALAAPKWWNNNVNNNYNNNWNNNGWNNNRWNNANNNCNQNYRIQQGFRNGNLTRGEANRLFQGERRMDRAERIARADGRISPWEARQLNQMQFQQNRAYNREMYDRQYRY